MSAHEVFKCVRGGFSIWPVADAGAFADLTDGARMNIWITRPIWIQNIARHAAAGVYNERDTKSEIREPRYQAQASIVGRSLALSDFFASLATHVIPVKDALSVAYVNAWLELASRTGVEPVSPP